VFGSLSAVLILVVHCCPVRRAVIDGYHAGKVERHCLNCNTEEHYYYYYYYESILYSSQTGDLTNIERNVEMDRRKCVLMISLCYAFVPDLTE